MTVVWENVPEEVPECEVLLLIGSGDTALRVTEELSPGTGSYRWTVPNVSARAARLILRMNRRGREVESPPSEPFAISMSPDREFSSLQWRDEEAWLADAAPEPLESKTLPTGLVSPARCVATLPFDSDPPVPPGGIGLSPGAEGTRRFPVSRTAFRRRAETARGNSPQCFPRRI